MARRARSFSLPALAVLAATACADGAPLAPTQPAAPSARLSRPTIGTPPGRYLVGFREPTTSIPAAVLAAAGGRVVDSLPRFNVLVVDGVTNPAALLQGGAAYVEAEFETTVDPLPFVAQAEPVIGEDAPWYESGVQWGMRAISAEAAWNDASAGAGATVCIVDSGVDDQHQELNDGRVALRANFVTIPTQQTPNDLNGHGTHVAGIAAARGIVVSGVAPAATVLSARVLNAANSGSELAILRGMLWCVDNGAHVLNVSLGGITFRGTPGYANALFTYGLVLDYAATTGAVVVIAAGNSNLRVPNPYQFVVPAQVEPALMVGATGPVSKMPALPVPQWDPFDPAQVWDGPDSRAFYSNFGPEVDVFAPGGRGGIPFSYTKWIVNGVIQGGPHDQIWSACSGSSPRTGAIDVNGVPTGNAPCAGQANRYAAFAGTSMAAPHVAGMATVLYAELGGARTPANRARVLACIQSTTDDIGDEAIFGGGRVNVQKALAALRAGDC